MAYGVGAMGFGIDNKSARLWKFPILYNIDEKFSAEYRNNIIKAMNSWGENLFRPVPAIAGNAAQAPILVKCIDSGQTQWRSGDQKNGKCPGQSGTVFLKPTTSYGNLVHEFGHCLGLAHEHDRADAVHYLKTLKVYAERPSITADVALRAQKNYVPYGSFDPKSIMCYPNADKGGPSKGDIETIAAIYAIYGARPIRRRNI